MTPDQQLLVVHFVKQLQQCIEKREGAVHSRRTGHHKEPVGTAHSPALSCQCARGKK